MHSPLFSPEVPERAPIPVHAWTRHAQSDLELMQFGTLKMLLAQQFRAEKDLEVSPAWNEEGWGGVRGSEAEEKDGVEMIELIQMS